MTNALGFGEREEKNPKKELVWGDGAPTDSGSPTYKAPATIGRQKSRKQQGEKGRNRRIDLADSKRTVLPLFFSSFERVSFSLLEPYPLGRHALVSYLAIAATLKGAF